MNVEFNTIQDKLKYALRDYTSIGKKTSFSPSFLTDEQIYNINPTRYSFYVQLLDALQDPNSDVLDRVLSIENKTRDSRRKMESNIKKLTDSLKFLKLQYEKKENMKGGTKTRKRMYQGGTPLSEKTIDRINDTILKLEEKKKTSNKKTDIENVINDLNNLQTIQFDSKKESEIQKIVEAYANLKFEDTSSDYQLLQDLQKQVSAFSAQSNELAKEQHSALSDDLKTRIQNLITKLEDKSKNSKQSPLINDINDIIHNLKLIKDDNTSTNLKDEHLKQIIESIENLDLQNEQTVQKEAHDLKQFVSKLSGVPQTLLPVPGQGNGEGKGEVEGEGQNKKKEEGEGDVTGKPENDAPYFKENTGSLLTNMLNERFTGLSGQRLKFTTGESPQAQQGGASFYAEKLKELEELENKEDGTERQKKIQNVIDTIDTHPIFNPEVEKISMTDRVIFIAVTFMIRGLTLFLIDWGINSYMITSFSKAFILYIVTYFSIFMIWALLANAGEDSENMAFKMMFYYVNWNANGIGRVLVHMIILLFLIPIPFIVKEPMFSESSEDLSFQRRRAIYSVLSKFTFFVWILTSVIALRY